MQNIPKGGVKNLEHQLSFVISDAIELGDMSAYISPVAYEDALKRTKSGPELYDYVSLTAEQWQYLCDLERKCQSNLPAPFTREALQDFCLQIIGTDYFVVFQQTKMPKVTLADGRIFEPKVDCTIGKDKSGRSYLGGIGLVYEKPHTKPRVAYYWVGIVKKHFVAESIMDILSDYFAVQYAFHAVPDRIVRIERNADQAPAAVAAPKTASQTTPSKKEVGRRLTPIQHTIYISDTPLRHSGRKHNYSCDCWYVRGFERTLKNGRRVWVNGYFKGRDRLNEEARRQAKNYILQED